MCPLGRELAQRLFSQPFKEPFVVSSTWFLLLALFLFYLLIWKEAQWVVCVLLFMPHISHLLEFQWDLYATYRNFTKVYENIYKGKKLQTYLIILRCQNLCVCLIYKVYVCLYVSVCIQQLLSMYWYATKYFNSNLFMEKKKPLVIKLF